MQSIIRLFSESMKPKFIHNQLHMRTINAPFIAVVLLSSSVILVRNVLSCHFSLTLLVRSKHLWLVFGKELWGEVFSQKFVVLCELIPTPECTLPWKSALSWQWAIYSKDRAFIAVNHTVTLRATSQPLDYSGISEHAVENINEEDEVVMKEVCHTLGQGFHWGHA